MKAESVCPKDELNEGAVNRVDQSERNAEIGAPESECWRWSGGGGSGFSGFAGLDSEQPVDRNVMSVMKWSPTVFLLVPRPLIQQSLMLQERVRKPQSGIFPE